MAVDTEILKRLKAEPATKRELAAVGKVSTSDFEIFHHKMELLAYEGREVFTKLGSSTVIQTSDLACCLYTASGDVAAAGPGIYAHSLAHTVPIKYVLKHYKDEPTVGIKDGDMFLVNEALFGGFHNQDQLLFMPIFYKGELIAWVSAVGHEGESGGPDPGGFEISAKDRWGEGLHISPIKIAENFQFKKDVLDFFENSVRDPRSQTLDTKARGAGCMRVRQRLLEEVERRGVDFVIGGLRKMIDVAAEAAKARLRELPDGTFRCPVFFDIVEPGTWKPYLVCLYYTLRKEGERVAVDLTGTSPETPTSYNTFEHVVIAVSGTYLFTHIFWDLPPSLGILEPFDWNVPKGCIVGAGQESAVSVGLQTPQIGNAAFHICMSKMIFPNEQYRELATAPWSRSGTATVGAGVTQYGYPFAALLSDGMNASGGGGRPSSDGLDAAGFVWCPLGDLVDVETWEGQLPILHLIRSKYNTDGYGCGKYRGGSGTQVAYVTHKAPFWGALAFGFGMNFAMHLGIYGGYAAPAEFPDLLIHNTNLMEMMANNDEKLPSDVYELARKKSIQGDYEFIGVTTPFQPLPREGDMFVRTVCGGGGYGDVLERDPKLVMKDLAGGITSHWAAENIYRVAYDPSTLRVDIKKTEELRQKERENRKSRGLRYDDFIKEWKRKHPPEEILKYFGPWPEAESK